MPDGEEHDRPKEKRSTWQQLLHLPKLEIFQHVPLIAGDRFGCKGGCLVADIWFSEQNGADTIRFHSVLSVEKLLFRFDGADNDGIRLVARRGEVNAGFMSSMNGLNELLFDGQILPNNNKEVFRVLQSIQHVLPPLQPQLYRESPQLSSHSRNFSWNREEVFNQVAFVILSCLTNIRSIAPIELFETLTTLKGSHHVFFRHNAV